MKPFTLLKISRMIMDLETISVMKRVFHLLNGKFKAYKYQSWKKWLTKIQNKFEKKFLEIIPD